MGTGIAAGELWHQNGSADSYTVRDPDPEAVKGQKRLELSIQLHINLVSNYDMEDANKLSDM